LKARVYATVLAAFGLQRGFEVLWSLRNERRIRSRERLAPSASPESFPWIVLANAALFTLPLLEALRRRRPPPIAVSAVGVAGAVAAALLRLSVIVTLGERWTVRAVVPSSLDVVDHGPYRFVRHPNYVALALEFAALPLAGGAYLSAVLLSLLNAVALWPRIRAEEALLGAIPAYRNRMASKPRFLPRWRDVTARPTAPATAEV
jgi:methyltransferase